MSWESTAIYYQIINKTTNSRLGGYHSAKLLLHSFDFDQIVHDHANGKYEELGEVMAKAALALQVQGADFVLMACNTMHVVAPVIEATGIPFLHIVDATAEKIKLDGIKKVGLLGTMATMTEPFFIDRLREKYGLDVLVPNQAGREVIWSIIRTELGHGIVRAESLVEFQRIVKEMVVEGAEGVILGCTEIGLLVKKDDLEVNMWDTAIVHAEAAVEMALTGGGQS
jgi:aspartate racemase